MKKIILKNKKEIAIKRRHPWVFSGAIKQSMGDPISGDLVEVQNVKKETLAFGHYYEGSISVRILKFGKEGIKDDFWLNKLREAYRLRQTIGLVDSDKINAYRLLNGEGDGLPGLIIDVYKNVAVIQCHTPGMVRSIDQILQAIKQVFEDRITSIYLKSKDTLPRDFEKENEFLKGAENEIEIIENENKFIVDIVQGQKTGFFLDQRENRNKLTEYVQGKTVLNTFCYTGGFSIYALNAGAEKVVSVDASQPAMDTLERNIALNEIDPSRHISYCEDVLDFLKESKEQYDIIVLDPPAYAKSQHKKHKAVQAYKRLNAMAMKRIKSGGILFTFSCSKVIYPELFQSTIQAAAIETGRKVRLLNWLSQGPDHPISIYHSEGKYLKGLVLEVFD